MLIERDSAFGAIDRPYTCEILASRYRMCRGGRRTSLLNANRERGMPVRRSIQFAHDCPTRQATADARQASRASQAACVMSFKRLGLARVNGVRIGRHHHHHHRHHYHHASVVQFDTRLVGQPISFFFSSSHFNNLAFLLPFFLIFFFLFRYVGVSERKRMNEKEGQRRRESNNKILYLSSVNIDDVIT